MDRAKQLDTVDPLRGFRSRFFDSGESLIYLDGNSLGRLPLQTKDRIADLVNREWGSRLIRGWNEGWIDLNERLGAKIARLIGAKPNEVILTDSTSLNLYKLAYAALQFQGSDRSRIVSDELNFPSDLYILQGLNHQFTNRYSLDLAKSSDGVGVEFSELEELINQQTALVSLSHVCFKTAFMYDMIAVNRLAQHHGALTLWDLSHAAGAVPVRLNEWGADLAVGCTYKYLNGGPGSVAFLYVREDLQEQLINPVWGWLADARPFDFRMDFTPAAGIRRFATSSPPILSAAAVEPGVDLLLEAGMDRVREKSIGLSTWLLQLYHEHLEPLGFSLGSPEVDAMRGSHVSIRHPEGFRIVKAMINPPDGTPVIIPDFREPDNIRLGLTPLYTSYEEVETAVNRLASIFRSGEFERYSHQSEEGMVT